MKDINRNSTSQEVNSRYAAMTGFYNNNINALSLRRHLLKDLLAAGDFEQLIAHAGKFAGRRPSLHIETGLLRRVQNAGLGHHIEQFPKFETEQFEEQLVKAEKLMTREVNFEGSKKMLIQAANRVFESCLFPKEKFVPTSLQYAAETQLNKQASAGFPFYQRKGQVLSDLLRQATQFRKMNRYGWLWPMTRGFRIQLRLDKGKVVPKIRVMYPYPGAITLIENTYLIPFIEHFIKTDTFYVIGRSGGQISEMLKTKLKTSNLIYSSDVSSFDQNMLNEVIIAAFGILRCQLKLTVEQADEFETMVQYFCSSLMISTLNGKPYAFIKHHGVPSGSGYTNLIDTLTHAIVLEYLHPGALKTCLICGDDNIADARGWDIQRVQDGYLSVFNLPISVEKTDIYTSSGKIKFLGFTWIDFIRHVDVKLVVNQLLWHTDFLTSLDRYQRELARGASVLLNGKNGQQLFEKIFPDVMKSLKYGDDVRFVYLFGYQPPTTLPGVLSYTKTQQPVPSTNLSLSLHLKFGWSIR